MTTFNSKGIKEIRKTFKNYINQFDSDILNEILKDPEFYLQSIPSYKSLKQAIIESDFKHCSHCGFYIQDLDFIPTSYEDSGQINCPKCGNLWIIYSYGE